MSTSLSTAVPDGTQNSAAVVAVGCGTDVAVSSDTLAATESGRSQDAAATAARSPPHPFSPSPLPAFVKSCPSPTTAPAPVSHTAPADGAVPTKTAEAAAERCLESGLQQKWEWNTACAPADASTFSSPQEALSATAELAAEDAAVEGPEVALDSCLPLDATIAEVAQRLVLELLQPILSSHITVTPPSPYHFVSDFSASAAAAAAAAAAPFQRSRKSGSGAAAAETPSAAAIAAAVSASVALETAGSCFYCLSAPCACIYFAKTIRLLLQQQQQAAASTTTSSSRNNAGVNTASSNGLASSHSARKRQRCSTAAAEDSRAAAEEAAASLTGSINSATAVAAAERKDCKERITAAAPAEEISPFVTSAGHLLQPPKLIDSGYLYALLSASATPAAVTGNDTGEIDAATADSANSPTAALAAAAASQQQQQEQQELHEQQLVGARGTENGFQLQHHARSRIRSGTPAAAAGKSAAGDSNVSSEREPLAVAVERSGGLGWETLNEVVESVEAIFNTISMDSIEDRVRSTTLPADPYYSTSYFEWRDFLKQKAPTGASVARTFGRQLLRSLLLAMPETIVKDLLKTPLAFAAAILFSRFCEEAAIPWETRLALWQTFASKRREAKSCLVSESGLGFLSRDQGSAKEEEAGVITFKCITNDRLPFSSISLVTVKNIFSRQLPKMPREYIVRLVFDRNHYTFCLIKANTIIGGCCFRPYFQQRFAEIAFLAVTSTEQVKGYGTRLMNHLKEHVKKSGIEYFLTYADNFAVGYFRKQGFTQKISMPRERWYGYIKDYEGGTFMECYVNPKIDYLRLSDMLHEQQQAVKRAILSLKPLAVYPGLDFWKKRPGERLPPHLIPGLLQCGWRAGEEAAVAAHRGAAAVVPDSRGGHSGGLFAGDEAGGSVAGSAAGAVAGFYGASATAAETGRPLHERILDVLEALGKHHSAWPFLKPVSRDEAPDYYDVIIHPTDIQTMKKKCRKKQYTTPEMFIDEVQLMFRNCRQYNHQQTIYFKYANELEKFVTPKLLALKQNYYQQQQMLLATRAAAAAAGVPPSAVITQFDKLAQPQAV